MNHTEISFIPLLIVIVLAFTVPIIISRFKRLAIPVVVIAAHTFGVENIISWVTDPAQNPRFRRHGVRVLNPGFSTILITESMVLYPDVFSVVDDLDETREVREVKLQNPDLLDMPLSEIILPEGVTALIIERQGNLLVPDQNTVLRANDTITLVGKDIDEAVRSFVREG